MLLQLRRQAIRNFPNGKRVALFTNPQLNIQLAIPYDIKTGDLLKTNLMPIKEALQPEHFDQFGEYIHHLRSGNTEEAKNIHKSMEDIHGVKALEHLHHAAKHYLDGHMTAANHHLKAFERHSKVNLKESNNQSQDNMIKTLTDVYDELSEKDDEDLTELEAALRGWLTDEIDEYGPFEEMPTDVLRDVFDDYNSLSAGAEDFEEGDEEDEKEEVKESRSYLIEAQREIKSFADWHEHISKKGEDVQFKMKNAGGRTEAHKHGKHLGSYDHEKKTGFINEMVITESPLHRINSILNKGKEGKVVFFNGAAARVHPHIAKHITKLLQTVNSTNKLKLSKLVNGSPEGLDKVAKFASEVKY